MLNVEVKATFGSDKSLDTLREVIESRRKYFCETAKQSVTAIGITVLKSVRAATSLAKMNRSELDMVVSGSLKASVYREGNKLIPCLRIAGVHFHPQQGQHILWTDDCKGVKMNALQVYIWNPIFDKKKRTYIIVAPSKSSATSKAKGIIKNRLGKYKGLARRALGVLMRKAATVNVADMVSADATQTAEQQTTVREMNSGDNYVISMSDTLDYAMDAVKGGDSGLDNSIQKAINMAVATINHKLSTSQNAWYSMTRLETPFPEVKKRK